MEYLKDMQVRLCLKETGTVYLRQPSLTSPDAVKDVLVERLKDSSREEAVIICLDIGNHPINICTVAIGTVNACQISMAEIFKAALLSNAAKVIFAHNHPSGVVTPSEHDRNITETLIKAGQLMGLPLLDHIIVGSMTGSYYSFFEHSPELFS